jgi:uncharacterized protein DUF4160
MPRISAFYGIVITMYFSEHGAPHFHAKHSGRAAKVEIATGRIIAGHLTRRDQRLVRRWTALHRAELEANWLRARADRDLVNIDPLP